jgi:peptidoglycan hydrolase CwlO-like protein
MNDWLKQNSWSIIIAVAGVILTFSTLSAQVDGLEKQTTKNEAAIQLLNTQQTQVQVQLAQISTDIQYIKSGLDRVLGNR